MQVDSQTNEVQTNRQTNRHTDTLITILRTHTGGEVNLSLDGGTRVLINGNSKIENGNTAIKLATPNI